MPHHLEFTGCLCHLCVFSESSAPSVDQGNASLKSEAAHQELEPERYQERNILATKFRKTKKPGDYHENIIELHTSLIKRYACQVVYMNVLG